MAFFLKMCYACYLGALPKLLMKQEKSGIFLNTRKLYILSTVYLFELPCGFIQNSYWREKLYIWVVSFTIDQVVLCTHCSVKL